MGSIPTRARKETGFDTIQNLSFLFPNLLYINKLQNQHFQHITPSLLEKKCTFSKSPIKADFKFDTPCLSRSKVKEFRSEVITKKFYFVQRLERNHSQTAFLSSFIFLFCISSSMRIWKAIKTHYL